MEIAAVSIYPPSIFNIEFVFTIIELDARS